MFFRYLLAGRVVWLHIPTRSKHVHIRGPRLELHPFQSEHHGKYKCAIKSKRSKHTLRTMVYDTYVNIHENEEEKPRINITIDMSKLFSNRELKLICYSGKFTC